MPEGDFDLALLGLLGEEAPLSASTVAHLKAKWEAWRKQPMDGLEAVYLRVDGVYVKAGLEKERAALLVAVAALSDGRKVVVAVTSLVTGSPPRAGVPCCGTCVTGGCAPLAW